MLQNRTGYAQCTWSYLDKVPSLYCMLPVCDHLWPAQFHPQEPKITRAGAEPKNCALKCFWNQ